VGEDGGGVLGEDVGCVVLSGRGAGSFVAFGWYTV